MYKITIEIDMWSNYVVTLHRRFLFIYWKLGEYITPNESRMKGQIFQWINKYKVSTEQIIYLK